MQLQNLGFFKREYYNRFPYFFKIINFIKFFFIFPIVIIVVIIYPFYKIRFGQIQTKTLGNCVLPLEIFYYEIKENIHVSNNRNLDIWCTTYLISNKFWYKKIKRKILILPGFFILPIFNFFMKFNIGKNFLIPLRDFKSSISPGLVKSKYDLSPCSDIFSVLLKNPPLINFDENENNFGNNFLKKNGILSDDRIICIHTRSNAYRDEKFKSTRNSSVRNFTKGVDFLTNKGFKVIRMGRDEKIPFNKKNKAVFDYSVNNDQSDFLDFFIISKCLFFVGADSGLADIAKIYRKPVLTHNIVNLKDLIHYVGDFERIFLPKKIWDKKKNKFLKFDETFKNNYSKITYSDLEQIN
jgi:putative glycosyltransferase (TIGR04372 family)